MKIETVRNGIEMEHQGRKWLITAELKYEMDYGHGGGSYASDVKLEVTELDNHYLARPASEIKRENYGTRA